VPKTMTGREARIAKNEVLFREVNERVREVVPAEGGINFICECGDEACTGRVTLTAAEYERIRADPVAFAIEPGHEILEVEEVVEKHDRYFVVRKHAEEQVIARQADPRA
jgi:hypothetical protein